MVLILTEAGVGIGFGHLTRTMALGEALIAAGAQVQMLVQWEGEPADAVIEGRAWVSAAPWRDDPARELRQRGATTAIVDSYRLPLSGYDQVAQAGFWLTVIDDCYRLPFPAHLVINPNVYAEPRRYLPAAREAMGGVSCVILRQPFVRAAASFQVRHELKRVLLTMGGCDLYDLGPRLVHKFTTLGFTLDWIVPRPASNLEVPDHVHTHHALGAEAMVQLVLASDAVVCGGGQTLHEFACLGVPCAAIQQGDDQHLNMAFYEQAGSLGARIHGEDANVLEAVTARLIDLREATVRRKLSALGHSLVDGTGVQRLAARIVQRG